jgi:glyoxylase-like metal-dependent hydrolase (beta-lactamase superfamily II)
MKATERMQVVETNSQRKMQLRRGSITYCIMTCLALISIAPTLRGQFAEPNGGNIQTGTLPASWLTGGPKCMEMPDWQVHEYNENLYILRQSGCTDTEMPFLYLFFGERKALLWDTGSRNGNLVPPLQRLIHQWLERNHRNSVELIVLHSHGHGDHTWGDDQLRALHDSAVPVTLIPANLRDVMQAAKIGGWPEDVGAIDLGGRSLTVVPIPGHDPLSIALYDERSAILLTGDSLYPGRLYVSDFSAYEASIDRLVHFAAGKPVAHILGNHIEQTSTPFKDFPIGSIYHPGEHSLEMSYGSLLELQESLRRIAASPRIYATRDFTIWPNDPAHRKMGPNLQDIRKRTQEKELKDKWSQPLCGCE